MKSSDQKTGLDERGRRQAEAAVSSPLQALLESTYTALTHYSNVHRGSGTFSSLSTHLFEESRRQVLAHFGLDPGEYLVIFSSDYGAERLKAFLNHPPRHLIRSADLGLPLGICAIVVKKKELSSEPPPIRGGGNARLLAVDWEIWARPPARFEAGTPALIPIIVFVNALRMGWPVPASLSPAEKGDEHTALSLLQKDAWQDLSGTALLEAMRANLIGKEMAVPVLDGRRSYVHFDHAASTFAFRPVWEVFASTLESNEEEKRQWVEEVREISASFLNAPQDQYDIYFTLNTTEAVNLLAASLGQKAFNEGDPVILSSIMEHSSNDLPWRTVPGHTVLRIGMDQDGFLDLAELAQVLKAYNEEKKYGQKRIRILALTAASNLLGTGNDVDEICRLAHQYGARVSMDMAQWVAHRPVNMLQSGIDFLVFSGHKMYAPFGTGVLVCPKNWMGEGMLAAQFFPENNAAGIAALGKAMQLFQRMGFDRIIAEEQALTRRMMTGLKRIPKIQLYGITDTEAARFSHRLGVFAFDVKGRLPGKIAEMMSDQAAIGLRSGCHCVHILVKSIIGISKPLERFQALIIRMFPRLSLPGMLRGSIGLANTAEDVDAFLEALHRIASGQNKKESKGLSSKKKRLKHSKEEYRDALTEKVFPVA